MRARTTFIAALAAVPALVAPASAFAHGLNVDDDPNRAPIQYVVLGFEHLALGWDHLPFIIGMVLLAPNAKTAAKLVTLFVLGHSLTLLVATLAGWQVSPTAVDVVIALSVIYVGVLGVLGGPKNWLLVVVGLWKLVTRAIPRALIVQRVAFGAMVLAGSAGAILLTAFSEDQGTAEAAGPNCSEGPRRSGGVDGGPPPKKWYEPGEDVPTSLFNHILLDGYVVVSYQPDLPEPDRAALEEWITARDIIVAGHPEPDQEEAIVASTVRNELACSQLDLDALTAFRGEWFETRPTDG